MSKLTILAAGVTGYVLGARAGRERYEQIKTQAQKVWGSPTVQSGVDEATTRAKHAAATAGSAVADKVTETVKDVVSSSKDDEPDLPTTTAGTPPPTLLD